MKSLLVRQESVLVLLIVALAIVAGSVDPEFLSSRVQLELSSSLWGLAIVAVPMTFVLLTGGIDLSVGAVMSLSAVAMGLCFERGAPWFVCVLVGLGTGVAAGLVNGFSVSVFKLHPLVVTLATMAAFFGLAEGLSGARPISGFPPELGLAVFNPGHPLPMAGVLTLASFLGAGVWLARSVVGQSLYLIGKNETAVRWSGARVDFAKTAVYALSGLAAAMAALFFLAKRNTAKADIGHGFELDVITAVVLGGASVMGGKGSLVGTLLGVLLLHEVRQFVGWHWERAELNLIAVGAMLIGSVLLNNLVTAVQRNQEGAKLGR